MNGRLLALTLAVLTIALIVFSCIWPSAAASAYAGAASTFRPSSTPQAAVENLADAIRSRNWTKAHDSLMNKAQFTSTQFEHDLTGTNSSLLTYSTLAKSEVRPLHSTDSDADMQLKLYWATVVGQAVETRTVHVVRNGDRWQVEWPLVKESQVPAQVIPVNYLRWDVIYRGGGDDWGAQDVEAPHIRIVDMHPVERAEGVVILGELLNEDVVPAYVNVEATLLSKTKATLGTEGSFDKISHLLLPKAVTPFMIRFPKISLADVGSIDMKPTSSLIAASADPVIDIVNQQINPAPDASVSGQLVNSQSGEVVNVAHVLSTFYDKNGSVVWIADQYVDHALVPGMPVPFLVHIPEDLAKNISTQRTVISTFISGGTQ